MPDSLVGTDSHTTMINGLGVVGWGVGGIEAEANMLGQPIYMLMPDVIGFKLSGRLPEGATATDLVLTVTQILRAQGVVGKFVEFYGDGLSSLPITDRATIANMSPEYGATMGFFPVDACTLAYLRQTARSEHLVDLVERYTKEQGLFRTDDTPEPRYTDSLSLDMSTVQSSLAGPKRPQDRILLSDMKRAWQTALSDLLPRDRSRPAAIPESGSCKKEQPPCRELVGDGSVVIAAITSCTNTSNPTVMVGAGLLAKKAVERGLTPKPYVKTSLAPGSKVVTRYLDDAGLTPYLQKLGFYTVGYGCTTCIGNSGPLPDEVEQAVRERDLVVCAVLSGNRNFEGRIHALVKANYLASPPLVVAYAIAGRVDIDLANEPLAKDSSGSEVYLRDIWPGQKEIADCLASCVTPDQFRQQYGDVFEGNERWNKISHPLKTGATSAGATLAGATSADAISQATYSWDEKNTYIQNPPFFDGLTAEPGNITEIHGARVLAMLGDSVTTDHISPAGAIAPDSPAGRYLRERGVQRKDFNSYGSRRGNDRVMTRGTFANVRLRNLLAPGTEGGETTHLPSGEQMSIYDAAMRYQADGISTIVLAGKEYGTGSSRDWAAKGTLLLGVRAVIADGFERIHRSNLVGMGVLPLQFKQGDTRTSLGLTGHEVYDIEGLSNELAPKQELTVVARAPDTADVIKRFTVIARMDTPVEVQYYRNGGILQTVLRQLASVEKDEGGRMNKRTIHPSSLRSL